jgi:hypothetical protein
VTDPPPPAWVPPVAQPVPPPIPRPLVSAPPPAYNPYLATPPPLSPPRGSSTLVIVLIVVGVLVALVVGLILLFNAFLSSFTSSGSPPSGPVTQPDPVFTPRESTAPPPTAPLGGPGATLTTEHGVSITVETPSCYNFQGPGGPGDVGRSCSVPVDVANDGPEQIKISSSDFVLFLGERQYTPNSGESLFFGVPRSSYLDPANGGLVLLWFDVAVEGGDPTRLEFQRRGAVDTALTVEFAAVPPPSPVDESLGPDTGPLGSTLVTEELVVDGGYAVTVTAVECGLPEAPDQSAALTPDGEFCRVDATVENRTSEEYKVSGVDFKLLIDGTSYTTSSSANRFGIQRRSDWIPPGETDNCVLYFDVPVGTVPTGVRFGSYWGSGVTFLVP